MAFDREIARLQRQVRSGESTPDLLLRLGQLYLRADCVEEGFKTLSEARARLRTVSDMAGNTDLDPRLESVEEALGRARALSEARSARTRRAELAARCEAGAISADEHEELLRLELAAGAELHPRVPCCPSCGGGVKDLGDPHREGAVRCARSGEDGDYCRHTDAVDLYACPTCGLIVRAHARRRRLKPDPHEPPCVKPERSRCPLCSGRVANWTRHARNCPAAPPQDFPRCPVCQSLGYHERLLVCPCCERLAGRIACFETPGT